MNKFNPNIHHRRSIRLKGYDYAQAGLYFVTICIQDRASLFGEIVDGKMKWNDAGEMIKKWYCELENKFSDIKCHEMVVMPNHFHCIVENVGAAVVGADTQVCPYGGTNNGPDNVSTRGDILSNDVSSRGDNTSLIDMTVPHDMTASHDILGEHVGSPLRHVMQWFKTMSTNEYIRGVKNLEWKPFNGKLWQRNYYEHIIQNEPSYHTISEYIVNNPAKWTDDKFNRP